MLNIMFRPDMELSPVQSRGHIRHHRQAVALLALCATLPLQWQALASTQIGFFRYFHITSVLFLLVFAGSRWAATIARQCWVLNGLAAAFTMFTVAMIALSFLNSGSAEAVGYAQQFFYATIGYFVALLVVEATSRGKPTRAMWWISPAALCSFLFFFAEGMRERGISPIATFRHAFIAADPHIINEALFRSVFSVAAGEEAKASMRIEIFGALIVCAFFSMWAMRLNVPRTSISTLLRFSIAVSLALAVLSLARAPLLAIAIAASAPLIRFLLTGPSDYVRLRFRNVLIATAALVVMLPAWRLIETRIVRDTHSYIVRTESAAEAISSISRSPITGSDVTGTPSPHNLILEAWTGAGIVEGILATLFVVIFLRRLLTLLGLYFKRSLAPFTWIGFAAGMSPLIAIFTAGDGQLHLTQWVSFGLSMGILQHALGGRARTFWDRHHRTRAASFSPSEGTDHRFHGQSPEVETLSGIGNTAGHRPWSR